MAERANQLISHLLSENAFLKAQVDQKEDAINLAHGGREILEEENANIKLELAHLARSFQGASTVEIQKLKQELSDLAALCDEKNNDISLLKQRCDVQDRDLASLKAALETEKARFAHMSKEKTKWNLLKRDLENQLLKAALNEDQTALATKKRQQKAKEDAEEDVRILKQALEDQKNEVIALKKQLIPTATSVNNASTVKANKIHKSNKVVYASLRKERDDFHYELTITLELLAEYEQKWKDLSFFIQANTPTKDGFSHGSSSNSNNSIPSISQANNLRSQSSPIIQPKPLVDVRAIPALSSSKGSTTFRTLPAYSQPPHAISSGTSTIATPRRRSTNRSPFDQLRDDLMRIDHLTREQLDQLREGLRVKVIMVAGQGFHVVGPFIRRNPGHREYIFEDDEDDNH